MKETLWVEKYRPKRVQDCVLPPRLKTKFQKFIADKNVPNLLLTGRAGVGKTTVAMAMLEEMGLDYLMLNSSLYGNIDTLRTEVTQFASSVSFSGGRKYVILDEADYLNINSTQPALRNFIESYSTNCGFILTCNYPNRILPELKSRLVEVDFTPQSSEGPDLMMAFSGRSKGILDAEGVPYDKNALNEVIFKYYPDWRKTINELQFYSKNGKIDSGMLAKFQTDVSELVKIMKTMVHGDVIKWVAEHSDQDPASLMREFYDLSRELYVKDSVPMLILLISKYQERSAHVADQEINTAAFLTECMMELSFK